MTTGFVDRLKGKIVTANQYTAQGGLFYASVMDGITATASATQSNALVLANMINRITTAAVASGVKLMPAIAGLEVTLINAGANTAKVFASGSDTIDTIAGSTGVTLIATKTANYYCATNGAWHSQVGA